MALIVWIARHLGRRPARLILALASWYFVLTGTRARRASRDYLSRVLKRRAGLVEVWRHFHTYALTVLDRVYFLTGQTARFQVRLHGTDALLTHTDRGRGCILLGAHLGSFEAMRAMAAGVRRFDLRILMYREQNRLLTQCLEALNPEAARAVIPLGGVETLLRAREALEQGAVVGVLGDRVAHSDKTVDCEFLGAPAQFPAGPFLMAAALRVPLVMCVALYRGANRYDVYFEPFSEPLNWERGQRHQQLQQCVERYARRLEHFVRDAPYNWFNFYDFWQVKQTPSA